MQYLSVRHSYTTYMQASASVLRIMRVTELFRIHTCDYARVPFLRCIVCTRLDDDHQPCHIGLRLSKQIFEFSRAFFRFSFPVKSLITSLAMSHWIETFSSKFLNFPALFRCRFSVKSLHHFICARASFIQFICEN